MTREQLLAAVLAERFPPVAEVMEERYGPRPVIPAGLLERDRRLVAAIHRQDRRAA